MYLYCLTQENYPGLSKKTKDKLPLEKSKTARSTARPPLLGWRCALVRILVFSFHLLSSSRRWLRWIDSGFLSARGSRFKLCGGSFIAVFIFFFFFKWGLRKIRSLSTEWRKESLIQIKLSFFLNDVLAGAVISTNSLSSPATNLQLDTTFPYRVWFQKCTAFTLTFLFPIFEKPLLFSFDIQPEEGPSIRAETSYPIASLWLEMRENLWKKLSLKERLTQIKLFLAGPPWGYFSHLWS